MIGKVAKHHLSSFVILEVMRQVGDRTEALRVDSPQGNGREHVRISRAWRDAQVAFDDGSGGDDALERSRPGDALTVSRERFAEVSLDRDMGVHADEPVFNFAGEAVGDGQHDDKCRNAEHNAGRRDERDDGDEPPGPLRP